ncbi:MAG: hypothetical protein AB8G99_15945, partial [Planctomycetaceae bacterium]
ILSSWEKGSIFRAGIAGLVFWLGMMLSLAMLPIAVIAAVHAGLRLRTDFPGPTQALKSIVGVIAAFAVTTIAVYLWSDINLWNAWILNYQNHAGFYQQFDRTYTKWILANPLELTLTLGSPLLVLTVAGVASIVRDRSQFSRYVTPLAVMVVWSLLWLSGKNMGEAARLWVLLTPMFLWAAAASFRQFEPMAAARTWWSTAICQLIVCVLTTTVVSGFSF